MENIIVELSDEGCNKRRLFNAAYVVSITVNKQIGTCRAPPIGIKIEHAECQRGVPKRKKRKVTPKLHIRTYRKVGMDSYVRAIKRTRFQTLLVSV